MNKIFQSLLFMLVVSFSLSPFLFPHAEAAENSWTTMADMPTARSGFGVAVVNGKIYAIGGLKDFYLNTNEEYDPATNTWATKKPMPTPRYGFGIAVYQNKVYVIGGRSGVAGYYGELRCGVNEVYDPATDTWETKASMPTNRSELCANVVDGKIYLIGGLETPVSSGPNVSVLNEVYDPATDSWTTKKSMPTGVYLYASAVVDNKIYVMGGARTSAKTPNLNQIYDPETDKWTSGKPLPTPVTDAAAGATTGVWAPKRIYVIGGRINYNWDGTNINQVYNPENDSWTVGASMPTARLNLAVAVVDDMLYALGGTSNALNPQSPTYAVNEQYTPFGFGTAPPTISIVSPENKAYAVSNVSLTFTVSETTSWICYSLDGQANVTITGNTTLTGLSDGSHSLRVYAEDTDGNTGTSKTIYFSIKTQQSEPFPTTWIVAAIAIIAIGVAALLVYFRKIKKTTGKAE